MGLETANWPKELVDTNPTSSDPRSEGDDHLRLIKTVLKNIWDFPAASTASEAGAFNGLFPVGSRRIGGVSAGANPSDDIGGTWELQSRITAVLESDGVTETELGVWVRTA